MSALGFTSAASLYAAAQVLNELSEFLTSGDRAVMQTLQDKAQGFVSEFLHGTVNP